MNPADRMLSYRRKRVRNTCPAALCLLVLNALLILPAFGDTVPVEDGSGRVSVVLNAGEYSITKDKNGFDVIMMEGFTTRISPGDPTLPHKVYNILIPPEADGESLRLEIVSADIQLLEGTYDIKPGEPDIPGVDERSDENITEEYWGEGKNIVDGRNLDVYERDSDYPESCLELLPYSEMRKWKFAKVDFTPIQYNPVSKKLTLTKSIVLDISYDISAVGVEEGLTADTVMDDVAPQLFLNYDEGKAWYEVEKPEFEPQATYDYVIITTNAIVANSFRLNAFIAHKQSLGYSVLVVTESNFGGLTGQAPDHRAEKIRQWLKNNYIAMGIKYVLLIGDPHPYESGEGDIPMKMCWPRYLEASYREAPTDYFYADLTGNWDKDGDQFYGEYDDDYPVSGGVDFSPEVYVGRIPVYGADYATLDSILQKTIEYETSLSTSWRKDTFLPMSFSSSGYDGAPLSEQMRDDYLNGAGYSSWRMYQQGNGACGPDSIYSSDAELRGGTGVRDKWAANDYGIACWWGHGSSTSTLVGYDYCWDGDLFSSASCSSLDDDHPSFTYQCSCNNAYPEVSTNLAYSILKNGGIGTVSATRVSWFNTGVGYGEFDGSTTNSGIGYEYVDRLVQELPGGDALYQTKQSMSPEFSTRLMNWYDFNLYGDPSVSLENPAPPTGWFGLGGWVVSLPNMIVDDQGRVHIFVVGGDWALWDNIDGVWYGLGGSLTSAPFPVKDNYGKIHVLVRGSDSALWDLAFNTSAWTAGWYGFGGVIAEMPTATQYWGTGNIVIMVHAIDDSLWAFDLWDPVGMSGTWVPQGGVIQGVPYVMEDTSGNVHAFVVGSDSALWDHVADGPGSFNWYGLGGVLSPGQVMPTAVNEPNRPGYVAVMVRAADDSLWVCDLWPDKSAHWVPLGGYITSGGYAITDTAGNIHTFVKGGDGAAWENVFSSWNPAGAQWHGQGGLLIGAAWPPVAFANGYTQMAVIGADSALWKKVYPTISAPFLPPLSEEKRPSFMGAEPGGPRGMRFSGDSPGTTTTVTVATPVEIVPVEDEAATMIMSEQCVSPGALPGDAVDGGAASSISI
jgi:hypothetical protein